MKIRAHYETHGEKAIRVLILPTQNTPINFSIQKYTQISWQIVLKNHNIHQKY